MTTYLPGPYSLAGMEAIVIDGVERRPGTMMRENSGALVIMAPHPDEDGERLRLGTVDLTIDVKRGQGWRVEADEDPQQMATARLWMAAPDLANAADAYLNIRDTFREWRDENPGASGAHFSAEADKVVRAETELRAAIQKARGQ